jgi:ATP-dependent Clp protease ATP-binding subunit ClpA
MNALIAGTKYRGEFEKRLKGIIDEIKNIPNALLFIDEIHTIIGAGATSGAMDAANQLKPALASGEITCMGATTYSEYRNSFTKDKALSRRFSKIDIEEPSEKTTLKILLGLKDKYEKHHNVLYTKSALKSAIKLSKRYVNDKYLPDKAIDIIDETAATFHLYSKQKKKVTEKDIQKTISKVASIPLQSMNKKENQILKNLHKNIEKNLIGQNEAITEVVKAIKISKAGLTPKNKPIASLLFMGQTGVGKTELSLTLAKELGIHFERFDMSEYMEKHSLSRLVGAPPGYVGYDEGGLLTEAIKKHPHTVLLLDEIEKADKELLNILLQIMDNATLTDSSGYKINFQNVILIMTSNIGALSRNIMGFNKDSSLSKNEELKDFFTPEFRNRLDAIVHFKPLNKENFINIIKKSIQQLNKELKKQKVTVTITQKALNEIAKYITTLNMGARPIQKYIQNKITNQLSDEILFGKLQNGGFVECTFKKNIILKYKNDSKTK